LPGTFQNNLRAIIVIFYLASDLHNFARQLAHIPNLLQIMLEHHHGECTKPVIFTKIEIVHATFARLHAYHFAGDALCFIKMITRLIKWNAGGKRKGRKQQGECLKKQSDRSADMICHELSRASARGWDLGNKEL